MRLLTLDDLHRWQAAGEAEDARDAAFIGKEFMMMRNFLTAYGGKILAWVIGVAALLTVPATAQSVHLSAAAVAWIAIVLAALNMAHSIFFTTEQVLAAKAALKSAWKS